MRINYTVQVATFCCIVQWLAVTFHSIQRQNDSAISYDFPLSYTAVIKSLRYLVQRNPGQIKIVGEVLVAL